MYEPLVSIVIPAYNASNYLAEAIESAINQTYPHIEIIVVNDGSTDCGKTARIAKKYKDKVRYFEKINGGSSSALNMGIRNMKGEWFSWLSHDDLYYPNKIEYEIALINKLAIDDDNKEMLCKHVFFAPADIINEKGKLIKRASRFSIKKASAIFNSTNSNVELISRPIQFGFYGCSCLIHRKAFDKVGFFDETLRLLNDMDMWFKLYTNNFIIHYIPLPLVMERLHSAQISRSIGFSYHNSEQDSFWQRSFEWLLRNVPDNYNCFYVFGRTAFIKSRFEDGDKAFLQAGEINPNRKYYLCFAKIVYKIYGYIVSILKSVYLKLKM